MTAYLISLAILGLIALAVCDAQSSLDRRKF